MHKYLCNQPEQYFNCHGCSYVRNAQDANGKPIKWCGSPCANRKTEYVICLESIVNTASKMVCDWNDSVGKCEYEKREALQSLLRDKFHELRRQFYNG